MMRVPHGLVPFHALWCHRIIRARVGHPSYTRLVVSGMAERRLLEDSICCDFVLTADGQRAAHGLFRSLGE